MSYLKFDKSRMVNLEYSLQREILRTNRSGAYHYTTIVECNTRKQHGLLVIPVPSLSDTNHVLLSSFDETVIQHGAEFNLGIHKYDGEHYNPMGHKYIREFDCDSGPRTTYRVGGVILAKEKMFSLRDNNIMIRYTLLDAHLPTIIRFKPFLAFREINSLTEENLNVDKSFYDVENGIATSMYGNYPQLYMQFSKKAKFFFNPVWFKGIEYKEDMLEGYSYKEDLYVPGYFELSLKKGETIVFSAGDKEVVTEKLLRSFDLGLKVRTPRSSFQNCLRNSAHQFYFRPNRNELYLLEGYPWFKVDARSQFISLPGLTLSIDRDDAFEEVMDTAIPALRQFMKGEKVEGYIQNIDNPDVLLWGLWALGRFFQKHRDVCLEKYTGIAVEIINYIQEGKHPNLRLLENSLLYTNGREKPVSWMNAQSMGRPIVSRTGCIVEFNALWYNGLMLVADMLSAKESIGYAEKLRVLASKVQYSFNEVFINGLGYLFDYVDGNFIHWNVRPNMIIAVSMDYSPLSKQKSKSILDIVTKELLTNKGLRTLSPKSEGYSPYYTGTPEQKAYTRFNGASWPWLLAPYIDACIKVFSRSGLFYIDRVLTGMEEEMANNCVGTISELYDGNPPYTGHEAPSYAMNVAGINMVLALQASLEMED